MNQDRTKTPTPIHPFADAMRRMKRDDQHVTRPARRTFQQMDPGFERQPVLRLVPPVTANNERCVSCDRWFCDGNCQGFAPVPSRAALKAVAA